MTSKKSDYALEQISKEIGALVSLDVFLSRADVPRKICLSQTQLLELSVGVPGLNVRT